jgi:hypothetical protein
MRSPNFTNGNWEDIEKMSTQLNSQKVNELIGRIKDICFSEQGMSHFPLLDHQLIMHPFENHVNFRIIRAPLEGLVKEFGVEAIPAITNSVNQFYSLLGAPHIQYFLRTMKENDAFNIEEKLSLTDNKAPFRSSDAEKESLWMSYEAYQLFCWIAESLSSQDRFLFHTSLVGTKKDKNIQRLFSLD